MILCNRTSLTPYKLSYKIDSYQTSIFVSKIIAQDPNFNKILIFSKSPSIVYTFDVDHPKKSLEYSFSNIENSLIIFYSQYFWEI